MAYRNLPDAYNIEGLCLRGDYAYVYAANGIPFNQYSAVLNKLRFSLKDAAGNVGFSPIYTVRIGRLTSSDLDDDHDVDQADFGRLQACLSGSALAPPAGCGQADLDADGDVDESDLQLLLGCMSGPNLQADERCAN